jgi:hypothetical protein
MMDLCSATGKSVLPLNLHYNPIQAFNAPDIIGTIVRKQ